MLQKANNIRIDLIDLSSSSLTFEREDYKEKIEEIDIQEMLTFSLRKSKG